MALVDDEREQVGYYDAVNASSGQGYELLKKRQFDTKRYPEYKHTKTDGGTASLRSHLAKEFIFEKTNKSQKELIEGYQKKGWIDNGIFQYQNYDKNSAPYFNKKVDETESSSSYEDDEPNALKF
jgi:hypothetical protein